MKRALYQTSELTKIASLVILNVKGFLDFYCCALKKYSPAAVRVKILGIVSVVGGSSAFLEVFSDGSPARWGEKRFRVFFFIPISNFHKNFGFLIP